MSTQLIDHNEDLRKLRDEGYYISIVNGNIVVKGIPYVNKDKKILFGTIYCPLTLSGNKTISPTDHTVRFIGEHPCDQFGKENKSYVNSQQVNTLTPDLIGNYYFSSKPQSGKYTDFYEKIKRYIELLSAPAKSIDPSVTAQKFDFESYGDDNVFKYVDTNSARAGITHLATKLKEQKIAIIGLGGTGSYVLDFVSKTPVKQISLFDGDVILNHNAFRMPGVIALEELNKRPSKVMYFKERYLNLREGIEAFDIFLNESNINLLDGHDFVFIAIDDPEAKKIIITHLLEQNIPFVDLGMGLSLVDDSLRGTIRKTLITPNNHAFLDKIPMVKPDEDNIYSQNIQITELNALNAILGIIAWKKKCGFYKTAESIYNSSFIIDEEEIINAP